MDPTASFTGRKHYDETKQIMSEAKKGESNPCFGRTGEKKKNKNPMYAKSRPSGSVSPSQAIEVYDLQEKTTTSYNSIREAARALNISSYK